jgi:hypothetical protein
MINPLRIHLNFFFKNRMIGFEYKGCTGKYRLYPDIDVSSLFSYIIKARWNKMVKFGLNYSTLFFDYIFSTFGITKRNSAIFINKIDAEKRLQLFLTLGFIVNIFGYLMSRKEFPKKNYGNSDFQINVSFAFETRALDGYLFKVTSLPQITLVR